MEAYPGMPLLRRSAVALALAVMAASAAFAAPRWLTLPKLAPMPAAMTSGYAPVDGIRMYYAEFGSGQPVLLLHGGLANSDYWAGVIPILVRHHFRVIVADLRGQGRSTRDARPYSYRLMGTDVLRLLDFLHLRRVDLVGWSDGGIIGLWIAMHEPQRLRRLFLYGASSDPSGVRPDIGRNRTFAAYVRRTRAEYRARSPTPGGYDALRAAIERMWATQPHFTARQLHAIRVPTAIADGAHDEAIKHAQVEYLARAIAGARLIVFPDLSHFGMLQNPEEFSAAVIKFLQGETPAATRVKISRAR
jgi:pimeloyl-ACP methyl ester carboxylesterase